MNYYLIWNRNIDEHWVAHFSQDRKWPTHQIGLTANENAC